MADRKRQAYLISVTRAREKLDLRKVRTMMVKNISKEAKTVRESTIENKFRKAVEATGARCLKFVSPGFVGVPDRIILLPGGTVFFAELKAPGKTERVRQEYVQGILRNMGFTVFSSVNTDEQILEITHKCREVIRNAKRV